MVRTKADAYTKAAVKAPRKQSVLKGGSSSTPKNSKSDRYSGGNPYCPRQTPAWQKPITNFFSKDVGKDKCAEKESMQGASASSSCVGFNEAVPSCSKDDPELMEFVDSETLSNEEEFNEDDSGMNFESASCDDSSGDSKLEGDIKNVESISSEEDSKLQGGAKNSESVSNEDSKLEEDAKNLDSVQKEDVKLEEDLINSEPVSNEEESKLNEDVKNFAPVPNENADFLPCGSNDAINNLILLQDNEDIEAIPCELDHQDDDSSNLSENSGINAATIGVHASPNVNDLDDQDSGCVDE